MINCFAKTLLSRSPLPAAKLALRRFSATPLLKNQLPSSVVVLEYAYGPRMLQRREPYHEGHLFLASEMIEQGKCYAGGPASPHGTCSYDGSSYGGQEPTGAFFWFSDVEAANEFLEKDPYALADIVTSYKIYDWNLAVSAWK